ncbi:MAG: hypothetical protein OEW84_07875 [Aigarchaeota archaeon]|nr:hypothetical protein [Aigarchaeota archaeon]
MTRTTEKSIALFVAALVLGLIIGLGIGYAFPYEAGILTEQQVRQTIRQSPDIEDLEVKPETIRFLTMSLEFRERERVWVVEYECAGRSWLVGRMSAPPHARKFVRVVMDARTGGRVLIEAYDLPFPQNVLTAEDVRGKIVEELGVGPTTQPFPFIQVKPETVEFRSFILVCYMKYTPTEIYRWLVEYECEGRGVGVVAVRFNDSEIIEPSFHRMLLREMVDARTGNPIEASY